MHTRRLQYKASNKQVMAHALLFRAYVSYRFPFGLALAPLLKAAGWVNGPETLASALDT